MSNKYRPRRWREKRDKSLFNRWRDVLTQTVGNDSFGYVIPLDESRAFNYPVPWPADTDILNYKGPKAGEWILLCRTHTPPTPPEEIREFIRQNPGHSIQISYRTQP